MALTIRREELPAIEDEWAELLSRHPDPVPFLHPTWQRLWLEEFQGDRELILLAARDGDALVGVAPVLREDGRLSLVGHYSMCDYMDFVVPEPSDAIFRALFDALLEIDWTEAELRGLRDGSPTLAALARLRPALGLACEQQHEAVSPRVEPPADWDAYLASLKKKHRHELRRKLRRLSAAGETALQDYTRPEDVSERLPTLLRFMVESRSDKAAFMSEQMGRFFHRMAPAMAEQGLVRLYELELDAKTVASVLCFDLGGQFFFYNSGYDPDYATLAVGLVSKALCLRNAIELGRHCVDFLRGDEPYKYDLGGEDQHVYRCLVRRR